MTTTPASRTRLVAKLALAGATAFVGLAATTATAAHAGPTFGSGCGEVKLIFAKPGVTTYGTACADQIIGTPGNDTIFALGGDDEVLPGTGNDTVYGGTGNDEILTGSGMDRIEGEAGDDFIMGGTESDTINGGAGDDVIRGEEGNDVLYSYAGHNVNDGSDELYGGDGNDYLNGYEGVDWLEGQAGNDMLESHEVTPAYDHLVGGQGTDSFAVKDVIEHDQAHRDDVDVDNFDNPVTNKNAADTFH